MPPIKKEETGDAPEASRGRCSSDQRNDRKLKDEFAVKTAKGISSSSPIKRASELPSPVPERVSPKRQRITQSETSSGSAGSGSRRPQPPDTVASFGNQQKSEAPSVGVAIRTEQQDNGGYHLQTPRETMVQQCQSERKTAYASMMSVEGLRHAGVKAFALNPIELVRVSAGLEKHERSCNTRFIRTQRGSFVAYLSFNGKEYNAPPHWNRTFWSETEAEFALCWYLLTCPESRERSSSFPFRAQRWIKATFDASDWTAVSWLADSYRGRGTVHSYVMIARTNGKYFAVLRWSSSNLIEIQYVGEPSVGNYPYGLVCESPYSATTSSIVTHSSPTQNMLEQDCVEVSNDAAAPPFPSQNRLKQAGVKTVVKYPLILLRLAAGLDAEDTSLITRSSRLANQQGGFKQLWTATVDLCGQIYSIPKIGKSGFPCLNVKTRVDDEYAFESETCALQEICWYLLTCQKSADVNTFQSFPFKSQRWVAATLHPSEWIPVDTGTAVDKFVILKTSEHEPDLALLRWRDDAIQYQVLYRRSSTSQNAQFKTLCNNPYSDVTRTEDGSIKIKELSQEEIESNRYLVVRKQKM